MRTRVRAFALLVALIAAAIWQPLSAEQLKRIGGYEGHYSLVPTTFLTPEIAAGYGITRSRDRALLNISIIDPDNGPVRATVSGTVKDLLGNVRELAFEEVVEGEAVYYLATVRHGEEEVLRFTIDVRTPDGASHRMAFQQKTYLEDW